MKTGRDFPIGTKFISPDGHIFTWSIVSHIHSKGSEYMTLKSSANNEPGAFTIDQTIFNTWTVEYPKSELFHNLYNKLI